ncbi:MAG: methylated-DNA--[protein]-cysteine S-methyltransferase [Thermodesulfobacteriota bacterium]
MNKKIVKPTPFGSICIVWAIVDKSPKVIRVMLSRPGLSAENRALELYPDIRLASCPEIDAVGQDMKRLLEGEPISFSLHLADLDQCGEFQKRVLRAEHAIPRGMVSTYQLIAALLGIPKGARAVGNALANNPFPLIVPCHRAIRSNRELGGYQGGLEMKQALLEMEGVEFDSTARVVCKSFYYESSGRG